MEDSNRGTKVLPERLSFIYILQDCNTKKSGVRRHLDFEVQSPTASPGTMSKLMSIGSTRP